jgi:hypothetical protein
MSLVYFVRASAHHGGTVTQLLGDRSKRPRTVQRQGRGEADRRRATTFCIHRTVVEVLGWGVVSVPM